MIPGPDRIIACPMCGGLGQYMTLKSGNTIDSRLWSDAFRYAPSLPVPDPVVKCRHCGGVYWRRTAKEVGTDDRWTWERRGKASAEWKDVESILPPNEEEYYEAIAQGLAENAQQEQALRILVWHRRNHCFRWESEEGGPWTPAPGDAWRENLESLARLMTVDDDDDRLLKAEVLRELGEFDLATDHLDRITSPRLAAIVDQMRGWCDAGDMCVREIREGD